MQMGEPTNLPELRFTTPRKLPDAKTLAGRVVVLDIAFAAEGMGTPFEDVTLPFIRELGSRLACWIDQHDHERQADFAGDERFHLATKAEHGACPEMVTSEIVHATGPVDTILTHGDLDGLYAAAKWILGGGGPYAGGPEAHPTSAPPQLERTLRTVCRIMIGIVFCCVIAESPA